MSSSFGWLDTDHSQRRRMLDVVDLFRERDTVDEIGIGAVRDTLSDALFPGTSTLHTRLRYVLFVPWLVDMAVRTTTSSDDAAAKLRNLEIRLIESLMRGHQHSSEEHSGIIGQSAGRRLQRMPSEVYWASLRTWGLRTTDMSRSAHLRHATVSRRLAAEQPEPDDPGARTISNTSGFNLGGIEPPDDLLNHTTMDLTPQEAGLLTERLVVNTRGSLLGWLTDHPERVDADATAPWRLALTEAPGHIRSAAEHAHRFSTLIHSARVLYNLLLAEKSEMPDDEAHLREHLHLWRDELGQTGALATWDDPGFWDLIASHHPRLSPITQKFVSDWIRILHRTTRIEDDPGARAFIRSRELRIKGSRARLHSKAALERWGGVTGLGRLTFRWPDAQRLLLDLHAPLRTSQAVI